MLKKLSADDWIEAGLRSLARDGFTALKADVLARKLKVSRGSFYWHFADIAAFEAAVMHRWRDVMAEAVIRELERVAAPSARLGHLLQRAFDADGRLEIAMRAWAASDPRVRSVVSAVDERRLAYLARMLRERGIKAAQITPRAQILYWSWLGFVLAAKPIVGKTRDRLIGELAALGRAKD